MVVIIENLSGITAGSRMVGNTGVQKYKSLRQSYNQAILHQLHQQCKKNNFFIVSTTLCGWSLIKVPQLLKFVLVLGWMFNYLNVSQHLNIFLSIPIFSLIQNWQRANQRRGFSVTVFLRRRSFDSPPLMVIFNCAVAMALRQLCLDDSTSMAPLLLARFFVLLGSWRRSRLKVWLRADHCTISQ